MDEDLNFNSQKVKRISVVSVSISTARKNACVCVCIMKLLLTTLVVSHWVDPHLIIFMMIIFIYKNDLIMEEPNNTTVCLLAVIIYGLASWRHTIHPYTEVTVFQDLVFFFLSFFFLPSLPVFAFLQQNSFRTSILSFLMKPVFISRSLLSTPRLTNTSYTAPPHLGM